MFAEMGWGQVSLAVFIVIVAFLLICLVLLQKNRGSGLSGAFGGAGGQSAFGTKTGDVLTWVTVGLTAVFLLLCIIGNWVFVPSFDSRANAAPEGGPTADQTPPASAPSGPRPTSVTPRPGAPRTQIPLRQNVPVVPKTGAPTTPTGSAKPAEKPVGATPPASGPAGS